MPVCMAVSERSERLRLEESFVLGSHCLGYCQEVDNSVSTGCLWGAILGSEHKMIFEVFICIHPSNISSSAEIHIEKNVIHIILDITEWAGSSGGQNCLVTSKHMFSQSARWLIFVGTALWYIMECRCHSGANINCMRVCNNIIFHNTCLADFMPTLFNSFTQIGRRTPLGINYYFFNAPGDFFSSVIFAYRFDTLIFFTIRILCYVRKIIVLPEFTLSSRDPGLDQHHTFIVKRLLASF